MNKQKLKGNLLLFLAALIWGISFIAQSKGVELISPIAFNGIRSMLGSAVLIPVILLIDYSKKKNHIPIVRFDKTTIKGGIICGVFLFIGTTLQTAGLVYTSPGKAGFITTLYMVIVPFWGLLSGRKPRPVIWLSVAIAVAGLYLMCINSSLEINKGDILIFICAFIFAGHILSIDHFSPKVDGVKLSFLQFFVCGTISLLYMFIFEQPKLGPILDSWLSIGYAGIMSSGVAYTLQIIGQKYTDPTSASILMSLESVFSTLTTVLLVALGWKITGGALTFREIFGCILMFGAIILVQLPEKKNV
ncbi:MAG: DMT family transporter [Monoglobales bacterium]